MMARNGRLQSPYRQFSSYPDSALEMRATGVSSRSARAASATDLIEDVGVAVSIVVGGESKLRTPPGVAVTRWGADGGRSDGSSVGEGLTCGVRATSVPASEMGWVVGALVGPTTGSAEVEPTLMDRE